MLDSRPLREMGWRPQTEFRAALQATFTWYLQHVAKEGLDHGRAAVPRLVPHPAR